MSRTHPHMTAQEKEIRNLKRLLRAMAKKFPVHKSGSEIGEMAHCSLRDFIGDKLYEEADAALKPNQRPVTPRNSPQTHRALNI